MKEKRYLVIVILLTVVVLLNLPIETSRRAKAGIRDGLAPFLNALSSSGDRVRKWVRYAGDVRVAIAEKEYMLTEIATLREQLREQEHLRFENEELRRQLEFAQRQPLRLIACEVISRDITGWWESVTLNKGREAGISTNMPVLTADGLVGHTVDVSAQTCEVLLLTDPNSRVSTRLSRTGLFGVLQGMGVSAGGKHQLEMFLSARPVRMDFIRKGEAVAVRDEVVTSGLGGIYPEGLRVGYVAEVGQDAASLYQHADVLPAADLAGLKYAYVVVVE